MLLLLAGVAAGSHFVDVAALAARPALVTGPWLGLLVGAVGMSVAWASSAERNAGETLRAAAALAVVAAPWAPWGGLLVCGSALALARRYELPVNVKPLAANDNAPGFHPAFRFHAPPRVSDPPLRSARPSAFD